MRENDFFHFLSPKIETAHSVCDLHTVPLKYTRESIAEKLFYDHYLSSFIEATADYADKVHASGNQGAIVVFTVP